MEQWVGTLSRSSGAQGGIHSDRGVVCSTPTKPYGFYWPKSHHEATACYHELISRLTELLAYGGLLQTRLRSDGCRMDALTRKWQRYNNKTPLNKRAK